MSEEPDLENALDGLMDAAQYADERIDEYDPNDQSEIEQSLCYRISELYQEVGRRAPKSDWGSEEDNSESVVFDGHTVVKGPSSFSDDK